MWYEQRICVSQLKFGVCKDGRQGCDIFHPDDKWTTFTLEAQMMEDEKLWSEKQQKDIELGYQKFAGVLRALQAALKGKTAR